MRSPLAYPLKRPVDGDAGGAADLQTDVMRFMAILALCLVAIFALVQSIPLAPPAVDAQTPPPTPSPAAREPAAEPAVTRPEAIVQPAPADEPVALTRSRWVPKYQPAERPTPVQDPAPLTETAPDTPQGFTLAFESDLALTRLVAAGTVGFYAISPTGARRMMVRESRVSFWDASTPNAFHEMEAATVPAGVVDALALSGGDAAETQWGVTLPTGMRRELDGLLREHSGGDLTINVDGSITLEGPQ